MYEQKPKFWVTMTDQFLSGWGCANGADIKAAIGRANELLRDREYSECMQAIADCEHWIRSGGFIAQEQKQEIKRIKIACHKAIIARIM